MNKWRNEKAQHRVLYVENGIGYGGAVICLSHLVRNLDRSRFMPMVVTGRTGPEYREIGPEPLWTHIPDRRIDPSVIRSMAEGKLWAARAPGGKALLNQVSARIDDLANFLPFFLRLLKVATDFQPSLIHANNEPLCNRAGILVGKVLRIPVICHVRGDQKGSRMMNWLYRLPNHFIPVSQWVSEGIGRLGVPKRKRTVIYDGIPLEELDCDAEGRRFRNAHGIPEGAFAVGLVGLLIPWKGQHLFIDAARSLEEEIPNLCMVIIGGTPEDCKDFELELKARVLQEGLSKTVVFTGHLADMPTAYNGLDVVVSASTSPEPLGTMVIECMAVGRPLIAPNHGGAAEMVDNNVTALLFSPGDHNSLADSIRRLYREPDFRKNLGLAAREKALGSFAVSEHVRKVQLVYEKVLSKKDPA